MSSRREVLRGGAALAGTALLPGCAAETMPGSLGGADFARGHRLRDGRFPEPAGPVEQAGVVIAGGGVAGLAAGWAMRRAGFDDFTLLELEDAAGGNARSGRNSISAYPLGAHYLPVPNREARALRTMLAEFGMIVGENDGAPVYDPYQLCADLDERLLWRGAWQEGLYPVKGLSPAERAERDAFYAEMARLQAAVGHDGRPAFAVPSAYSSRDPQFIALDRLSFSAWLDGKGWHSPVLRAYLRYCCRDDYGTEPEDVSAWAGIHYFAGRRGWAADGAGDNQLTWPEGNGRLAGEMGRRLKGQLRTGQVVYRIARDGQGAVLDLFDERSQTSRRIAARAVVLAMPHFVAARVAPDFVGKGGFSYAPWVVANVSVDRHPQGRGVALAWDNVSSASASLGYVVATHQTQSTPDGPTVLTWYMPLSTEAPKQARQRLLKRSLADWQREVRDDLLTMNPDLAGAIRRIDVWRWGHAMIRPTPGFLTDPGRLAAEALAPPVFLAHSDVSGLSLFEEAHYRGVAAAEAALALLGRPFESLL